MRKLIKELLMDSEIRLYLAIFLIMSIFLLPSYLDIYKKSKVIGFFPSMNLAMCHPLNSDELCIGRESTEKLEENGFQVSYGRWNGLEG